MELREKLVSTALEWQRRFGVAPRITSAISEYDAAILIGCTIEEYSKCMQGKSAVTKGYDFEYRKKKYQVKASRPSGNKNSAVWHVPEANNYLWDYLIWILYDRDYTIQEAWLWAVADYKDTFQGRADLSPRDMRRGKPLHKITL